MRNILHPNYSILNEGSLSFSADPNYWWYSGIVGVILSQFLILNYWSDAKFGTIANVIILLVSIIGYSDSLLSDKK